MWFLSTLDYWENMKWKLNSQNANYRLNTAISFSRLRSLFCFFFTHFMANIFPVFFSFTMYTSENAPLFINAATQWARVIDDAVADCIQTSQKESSLFFRIKELLIKYGDLNRVPGYWCPGGAHLDPKCREEKRRQQRVGMILINKTNLQSKLHARPKKSEETRKH